jgi:hypothetical protein
MLMATSPLDAFKLYYEELPSDQRFIKLSKLLKLKRSKKNARKP